MLESKREAKADALQYRTLEVRASTLNKDERSVECLISTENPVSMYDWDRGEVIPEILLTEGAILPRSRQVPLLNTHMRYSLEDVLGSARSVKKSDEGVTGRLQFSSLAQEQFTRVEEGHITDVSAGYKVDEKQFVPRGEKHKIANRFYSGPVNVVTKWRLREVSLVPIGADDQAKLRGINSPGGPETNPHTEELTMNKELRELLTSRGMPADLDDQKALDWLNEHRAEVFSQAPTGSGGGTPSKSPAGADGETRKEPDIKALVKAAVDEAVPHVINLERERSVKFRAEVDGLIEISGFKGNAELTSRCYEAKDTASARAEILKWRTEHTVDVGSDFNFAQVEGTNLASIDKFRGALGTAILMRTLNGDEKLAERVCDQEIRWNRPTPYGIPTPWAKHKERSAGWQQFQNLSLLQIAAECLRFEGVRDVGRLAPWQVAQAALGFYKESGVRSQYWDNGLSMRNPGTPAYHTTGNFAALSLDAMNKTMLAGYIERPMTWEGPFRRAESAKDFKKIYRVRLGEFPNLDATPDNKAPNQASFADEKESYAVEAYSKEISFSWQLIINDDMSALSRTPRMMGAAASRTVNTFVWSMIETNPLLQDGVAWFSGVSGARLKSNLIASASGAPTIARMGAMRQLMRVQAGVNTPEGTASQAILDLVPRYWAVPTALEILAKQLTRSVYDTTTAGSLTYNPNAEWQLQVIVEPLLDAQTNGATASIMFCDPNQCDTAEVAFLQGQETPFTRNYMDDRTMAMNWQIWQTFGGKPIDFRGVVRDKGIA